MADPLLTRVRAAVAQAVRTLTPEVPEQQVYDRAVGELVPERDKLPAIIVSETPGSSVDRERRIGRTDFAYPVTIILADAMNRKASGAKVNAVDPNWRDGWRDRLLVGSGRLVGKPLAGVGESLRVLFDQAVLLDLTAFQVANLWYSVVTLRVLCRVRD